MTECAVLVIAGSDSSGGAGIAADITALTAHRVAPRVAITAITAQGAAGVRRIDPVTPECLRAQIDAALSLPVHAIKIGMLAKAELVQVCIDVLQEVALPVVLDPVLASSSGADLIDRPGRQRVREGLLPLVTLATPNAAEARLLWGQAQPVQTTTLVTGGDEPGNRVRDTLWTHGRIQRTWESRRLDVDHVRGTGCTLSSAIAARLALGATLDDALDAALTWNRQRLEGLQR